MMASVLAWSQAPGTTPVKVSNETQMLHGKKYYVHIVERGQTVYSISRAYKVQSYDAVTHVDIHFLHAGDTVWLPYRGQFGDEEQETVAPKSEPVAPKTTPKSEPSAPKVTPRSEPPAPQVTPKHAKRTSVTAQESKPVAPPAVRQVGRTLKVALMMPLHLNQIDEISTTKFDIEQRGKRSYRQFEFIEFYEGIRMALDKLADQGVSVELNVVDVSSNDTAKVSEAFASHHVAESDVLVALLLRECFDKAADLAREAGIYIVNPMATRSDICADNPYMVKMQPSTAGLIARLLNNVATERQGSHLYIVHSGAKSEKSVLDEMKRQLEERGDIKYTLFNWSQSAKLATVLKKTPGAAVVSIYDQGKDQNRVYVGNLLNRLTSLKQGTPVLYTLGDWTREYGDVDFNQLQNLNYHTFATGWDMTNDVHVEFLKDFRTRYGNEPTSPLAATGYDLTLYIVGGLHRKGADFWNAPGGASEGLTQPIHLVRSGAGLENDRAMIYRMQELVLVPVSFK